MDNPRIIHAPMNRRRFAETSPITQYDYGYLLLPEGVELPATYEIDFSNDEKKGTSLPVYGGAEGAEVPEELIRTGKDVYAFYYHVGDGFGKTEFTWRLPNKCRPSRDGETPTPSQQSSIDQLIVRSNEAVTSAEQSASDASASAQSAQESAEQAETAQRKAEEAQESAERAKDDAETSERNASESERNAKGYAETASAKADAITGLTAQATTLPDGSSAMASYDAETGVMSFGIPKGKDGTNGTDGYSPTASVTKSGKVATITITDKNGTTNAQVSDGEDGATGATPNLTIGTVETLEPTESATATITGTPENPVLNLGIPQGEQGEVTTEEFLKAFVTDSASGSIASFPDGADEIPLKSLVVDIDPVQDTSSGDPSPENICPISGWDGVNVRRCNENLWDDDLYTLGDELELITDPTDDFYGYYNGSINNWTNLISAYTRVLFPNGVDSLTVTADYGNLHASSRYTFRVYFRYTDGTSGYNNNIMIDPRGKSRVSKTSTSGKKCMGFALYTTSSVSNMNGCIKDVRVSINGDTEILVPITAVIPISLGQTVYGGKLDVLTGKLTVTHAFYSALWGDMETYESQETYVQKRMAFGFSILTGGLNNKSNIAPYGTGSSGIVPRITANNRGYVYVTLPVGIDDATPIQVMSKRETPIEIQLTPHEVNSLLGTNNIWADTGDASVEYRADTKLYINRLTEPDADMIADSNITSGQYFMVGNSLFKATANIANGASIIVGTNCIRKSLSEALNEINA